MSDKRKNPIWPLVVAVILAVLAVYPLSFGPACWEYSRSPESWESTGWRESFYHPILWAWHSAPAPVGNAIGWYANLGAAFTLRVTRMDDGSYWIYLRQNY